MEGISPAFLNHATEILAETQSGLSGPEIVRLISAYAVEYDVDIPHVSYPFDAPNKHTALYQNILPFSPTQQYRILRDLCDQAKNNPEQVRELKLKLVTRYSHLSPKHELDIVNETLIEQVKHWLDKYPESLELYNVALQKHENGLFYRNVLDDLRLSLEKLLRVLFNNQKSLENQISHLGRFIKTKGGSSELSNMFVKLIDYYSKYQNSYIKHDDAVIEAEVDFIFEITSSFMKHLVKLASNEG